MKDKVINVPYNNPSLLPLDNYNIDIREPIEIELKNNGYYGDKEEGQWSIINRFDQDDGKEITIVDLVTLKKVLDKQGLYPNLKRGETASLCQLSLVDNDLTIKGDIVKVTKSKKQ